MISFTLLSGRNYWGTIVSLLLLYMRFWNWRLDVIKCEKLDYELLSRMHFRISVHFRIAKSKLRSKKNPDRHANAWYALIFFQINTNIYKINKMKLSRYALYMYDYSILLLIKVHYPCSANQRHSVILMKL